MIKLVIGENTKCEIPNQWNELTISQYAKVVGLLKDYDIKDIDDVDEHLKDQQKLKNIKANRDVFQYLSKVPMSTIAKCNLEQMGECLSIVSNFLNSKIETVINDESTKAYSFIHKDKEYFFPLPQMKETTFGDYIEAEQIAANAKDIEGGRFGLVAKQMAILCKEENEETTEELTAKKSRIFESLTMDIVWEFVFFLIKQTTILRKNMETYSKADKETKADTQVKIGT